MVAHGRIAFAGRRRRRRSSRRWRSRRSNTAPATGASPLAGASVDARAWSSPPAGTTPPSAPSRTRSQYLGTPFDVLNASTGPDADRRRAGHRGARQVQRRLPRRRRSSGGSAFTDAEWTALTTYEVEFGVRRVALYTSPNAVVRPRPTTTSASIRRTTPDRGDLHRGRRGASSSATNCANPDRHDQGYAYPTAAADGADDAAAGRRERQRLRRHAQLPRRARGAGAHLRSGVDLRLVPGARLRAGQLGDARAVRRRAPRLRDPPDRRPVPGQRHLHRRHLPDHRRRSAGVRRLAERRCRPSRQRAGFRLAWAANGAGSQSHAGRSADRQGGGARADVRLDQPQLGSPGPRRAQLRRRAARSSRRTISTCAGWASCPTRRSTP